MQPRTRKFVGVFLLFAFLVVYALLAMAVAIVLQVNQTGWIGALAYHAVAGLLWVPAAGYIIQWMHREPAR